MSFPLRIASTTHLKGTHHSHVNWNITPTSPPPSPSTPTPTPTPTFISSLLTVLMEFITVVILSFLLLKFTHLSILRTSKDDGDNVSESLELLKMVTLLSAGVVLLFCVASSAGTVIMKFVRVVNHNEDEENWDVESKGRMGKVVSL